MAKPREREGESAGGVLAVNWFAMNERNVSPLKSEQSMTAG